MPNKKLPKLPKVSKISKKIARKVMKGGNIICPPSAWCFEHNTLLYGVIIVLLIALVYFFIKSDTFKNIRTNMTDTNTTEITNVYNYPNNINASSNESSNSATIYPPHGTHTANYTNPFAPPLKPNHYFMTGKSLDIRDMNVSMNDNVQVSNMNSTNNQSGVPINVKTSHRDVNFAQVGILTNGDNGETILPLFGRPLATNRNRWQYYTMNDKFQTIKLPVTNKNRSCSGEYGCEEVFEGDNINVKGFNQSFKATIYESNTPEYIPYV